MSDLLSLARARRAILLEHVKELDAFIRTAQKLQAEARLGSIEISSDPDGAELPQAGNGKSTIPVKTQVLRVK